MPRLFLSLLSTHELPFLYHRRDEKIKVDVMNCEEERDQYMYYAEGIRAHMHTLFAKGRLK